MELVGRLGGPLLVALFLLTAPPWPDDWDGIGFLSAIEGFDMDHFAPHPPGYPVYVAALRLVATAFRDPMRSAAVVAAISGAAAVGFLERAATHMWGRTWGAVVALAVLFTPIVWRSATAVGSEAPALACAAFALWGASRQRTRDPSEARHGAFWLGVGVGLGLGVRLSWAPIFLGMFALPPRRTRLVAVVSAITTTLAWAVPFFSVVGPRHLFVLVREHLSGHVSRWGGTVVTDPGVGRLLFFIRDVFVDGLGTGADVLGVTLGIATLGLAAAGVRSWWRRRGSAHSGRLAIALVPYALWVVLGQNLRQQPRHVLPLVVALTAGLALAGLRVRRARGLLAVWLVLLGLRTAGDAYARRTTPPPGEQLLAWVRGEPSPSRTAVFGGASIRFFERSELSGRALGAGTLGDVTVALSRLDELPWRVLVTDEVEDIQTAPNASKVATFCRPPRADRRSPCLTVYELRNGAFLRRR